MARNRVKKKIDARGRHCALEVTTDSAGREAVKFQCPVGHVYVQAIPIGPRGRNRTGRYLEGSMLRRMANYWTRENGGVAAYVGDCPSCKRLGLYE